MKTGKYTLREFFSDRDLNTIVIPEIQRDYVWGKEQIHKFLESIIEDFKIYKTSTPIKEIVNVSSDVVDSYNAFYKRNYLSSNIGFIYAYSDADYPGSYFLIDGQQRFTTIFLTLLVLTANGDEQSLNNFKRVFVNEDNPKLDYRVREASHIFLCKLVQELGRAKNKFNSNWIKEQSWYLQDYDNDATISSIIRNIDFITDFLRSEQLINQTEENIVDKNFVEYVEDYLEFWYFDTNISEQGEELYIYMNARGEFMQDNENLKADLIGKQKDAVKKKEYGTKWEDWQDFFWRNRGSNPNADKGFNEFLNCLAGLTNRYEKKIEEYSANDFRDGYRGKLNGIAYDDILQCIHIEEIGKYVDGIEKLFSKERIDEFKKKYDCYCWNDFDWIDDAKKCFWNTLNGSSEGQSNNWFGEGDNINSYMNYVWAVLKYSSLVNDWDNVDDTYRTLRLFYIRMNNNNRRIQEIQKSIPQIIDKGPWYEDVLLTEEEKDKYKFLKTKDTDDLRKCEAILWKIENHPLNRDASEGQNKNCSHLVDFKDFSMSLEKLQKTCDIFYDIFPKENGKDAWNNKAFLNSLLFTSLKCSDDKEFWLSNYHGYYFRLQFNDNSKIIRGISNNLGGNKVFETYFKKVFEDNKKEYTLKTEDVEIAMHRDGFDFNTISPDKIIYALCWYAASKGDNIWNQGWFMAFNRKCFVDNDEKDAKFPNLYCIENFKGNFRGGNPQKLSDLNPFQL